MRNTKVTSEEKGTRVTVTLGISGDVVDPLAVITGITEGIRNMEPDLRDAIRTAREQGRSWQEIADKLGVTRQAAWERYRDVGDEDPISAVAGSLAGPGPTNAEMRRRSRNEEAEAEDRGDDDPGR